MIGLAGDSAGGVLVCGVAIRARDAGSPRIAFQINCYGPVIRLIPEEGSALEYADGPVLRQEDVDYFWDQYVDDTSAYDDFRASPVKAANHTGLPPTLIVTAECDPIRDAVEASPRGVARGWCPGGNEAIPWHGAWVPVLCGFCTHGPGGHG